MSKLAVTSGQRFTDIDGLACAIAYAEIPDERPEVVLPGPLNQSVTQKIRQWGLNFKTSLEENDHNFVIVDVSETSQFAHFVNIDKIVELYDHHFGFEKFWQEKLGEKAKIEAVGACATLIWEEFNKRSSPPQPTPDLPRHEAGSQPTTNPHPKISTLSANLLYTAIFANTLNFKASITTERDKKASSQLKEFSNLPKDWISKYYLDLESEIHKNAEEAIKNDTKIQIIKGAKCAIAQVELWNSRDFLRIHKDEIRATLKDFGTELWFFTSPCISEARNYIYTEDKTIRDLLSGVMDIQFEGDIGITSKLWLRKEILKKIQ